MKRTCFALILMVLLAAACSPTRITPVAQVELPTAAPSATIEIAPAPEAEDTPTPAAATGAGPTETIDDLPPVPSGCTVVTRQFAPEPTLSSVFPPVDQTDWSIGPETAALTIVEYGDFQ